MSNKNDTNLKDAIVDIAKNLENVFKKYSKNTRTKAWEKITGKEGEREVKKILNDPKIPINTFQKLATQKENYNFKDWLLLEEKSSKTKSGKKVPGKYLSGLSEKGKHGSKQAMKKEIEKFRGKDEYKLNWDADYKHGKRIKTKKGKATKAFEKKFGKSTKENLENLGPILDENVSKALENKAKKSGISVGTLRKVYNRGKAAWNSGHRPGVAQNQWAMGRVNSFITGVGGARKADKDLWKKKKKNNKK